MNNKKIQVWLPLLFSLVMILGMFFGYKLRDNMGFNRKGFFATEKTTPVQEVINLINARYVDSVGIDSLGTKAIQEILSELDPHSLYIPAEDLKSINEELNGNFEGIGVEFDIYNDTVNVLNVMPGGPSDKAGIQIGDRFIKIDTTNIAGIHVTSEKMKKLLRGESGSKVSVKLLRGNQEKTIEIARGLIPLTSVDAAYLIQPGTGYIKLNKFSRKTYEEFMESLDTLKNRGMQKLVLDLRGNGGGILEDAVQIADEFLDDNKLIVYTKGAHTDKIDYKAKRPGMFEEGKITVLVDEFSASASEVLAGALQDWDRATVIGRRSFGKGLVQEPYSLSDGSQLRLTVARYYTPLGRNIQKPYNKGMKNYSDEVYNRYHNGELVAADSNKIEIGKPFKTPKGKIVYGGGGIMPDVFVPFDTTNMSQAVSKLYEKRTLYGFIYRYYIQNMNFFKAFKSAQDYNKDFVVDDRVWKSFAAFAAKDSIQVTSFTAKEKETVSQRIKAYMAQQLFRREGYFEVANQNDEVVKKALDELNKK
ncbi:MAG: S41 family peptidase [Sphingobacteriales bacterium]|nr:MAG: S41 family peptidase [Sphingobacteriales bacterium]